MTDPYRTFALSKRIRYVFPRSRRRIGYLLGTLGMTIWAGGLFGAPILHPLVQQVGVLHFVLGWLVSYLTAIIASVYFFAISVPEEY